MIFPELDSKSDELEAIGIASNHPHRVLHYSAQVSNIYKLEPDESVVFSHHPVVRIPMILTDNGYPSEYGYSCLSPKNVQ